jgi:phosphatidylglycerol lysyltransferase
MRPDAPASLDPTVAPDAPAPTTPTRGRWSEWISKNRQTVGLGVTLLLFCVALVACHHLLSELDIYALHDSVLNTPKAALFGALAATAFGFIVLLGYEWSASRYASVELKAPTLILGGFTAFAIGNAIGLSMLSGGSVRYRLYARKVKSPG